MTIRVFAFIVITSITLYIPWVEAGQAVHLPKQMTNAKGIVQWKVFREYDLKKKKIGPNLKKIVNKKIKVVGFMMPLDYSAKSIKEFLLLPYVPTCSHTLPPPFNQIIKVTMKGKSKIKLNYSPVIVEGVLEVKKKDPKKDPYGMLGVFSMQGLSVDKSK